MPADRAPAYGGGAEEKPTSGKCGENVTWSLDAQGVLTIEGTGPMDDYYREHWAESEENDIPAPWGFKNLDITKVVIKPGVTSVGNYAFFGCENIASVTLPETVKRIGDGTFVLCFALESITLPDGLEYLGVDALAVTNITSIVIPDGITEIADGLFSECIYLTSVTIPDSVTRIGVCPFYYCLELKSVDIPKGVTVIGDSTFYACGITSMTLSHNITAIEDWAFCGSDLASITIPDSVTSIGWMAFAYCEYLTSIVIPDSVTSMGEEAFYESALTSITLSKSITRIEKETFAKSKLKSITIPDGVTEIGEKAFRRCTDLTSVTIPESVTAISADAFDGCGDELTIYGEPGSYAEAFAKENNLPFAETPTPPPAPGPVTPVAPAEPDPGPITPSFVDVPSDAYYADAVRWAVENGIASGTDETHFSPNSSCTRAQAVTFLWRAAGKPKPQGAALAFTDVAAGSYYEKAVQWAVEQGITSGTGGGKFSPGAVCTRAQIVAFLYRAQGSPEITGSGSFHDVKAGAYYENAVQWAAERGITSGTGGSRFSPDSTCTRGQIVTFLRRCSK